MSTARSLCLQFLYVSILAIVCCHSAHAQTSSAGVGKHSFESRFWNFLIANNYKNWAPPTGRDGNFFAGSGPHGALLKLYLNRTAVTDSQSLDNESVIVMEDYRTDKTLKSISVMLRSENSNPAAADWYWVVYRPDGSVIESSRNVPSSMDKRYGRRDGQAKIESPFQKASVTKTSAGAQTCVQCHRQAPGDDFVFFNQGEGHRVATDDAMLMLDDATR